MTHHGPGNTPGTGAKAAENDTDMAGPAIQLNMQGRSALVVGAAPPAARCIAVLLSAGAEVTVVAPALGDLPAMDVSAGRVDWQSRPFETSDVAGKWLVIAASDSSLVQRQVRAAAGAHGCLFNDAFSDDGDCSLLTAADRTDDDPWHGARICLVGAGPGDPGLLTVDGRRVLAQAEVVLYDNLVPEEVLALAPDTAERIFVGKQRANHRYRQPDLNTLMVELAHAGRRVVRLKGGDPYVFGRGGEEAVALAEAGVHCRVIPGITAGSGCATYADIPLTHRDHAHSCQFITAQGKDGESEHDWGALVRSRHTLVVYMGLVALERLCPKLIEHGLSPDTPAALIERGTTPHQRVLTGTVASVAELANSHALQSPALLVIGQVVRVREQLQALRGESSPADPAVAGTY